MASNYKSYADAAIATLMSWYNSSTGRWESPDWQHSWWHSATILEAVIDYSMRTSSTAYYNVIANTFAKNKTDNILLGTQNNFINGYYDDEGWWALTWIKAYDLTGIADYLNMAETIFNDMTTGWDQFCSGGIMWKKWDDPFWKGWKNAIPNELFLTVAARLYQRTSTSSYLNWAQAEWKPVSLPIPVISMDASSKAFSCAISPTSTRPTPQKRPTAISS